MNRKIKVLIGDDSVDYGLSLAEKLREMGLYAYTRKKDGNTILESLRNEVPDVIIADLTMPNLDAIALMRRVSMLSIPKPEFIITSSFDNSFIEKQVLESGAAYFIVRPFEPKIIQSIIKAVVSVPEENRTNDIELEVTDVIHQIGIPANIKGYHYLREAILKSIDDRAMLDRITKMLYPAVARSYSTTSSRVERAIRHAIDVAWTRGNIDIINAYFGCTVSSYKGRPTNSEFIAMISDRLALKYKKRF